MEDSTSCTFPHEPHAKAAFLAIVPPAWPVEIATPVVGQSTVSSSVPRTSSKLTCLERSSFQANVAFGSSCDASPKIFPSGPLLGLPYSQFGWIRRVGSTFLFFSLQSYTF